MAPEASSAHLGMQSTEQGYVHPRFLFTIETKTQPDRHILCPLQSLGSIFISLRIMRLVKISFAQYSSKLPPQLQQEGVRSGTLHFFFFWRSGGQVRGRWPAWTNSDADWVSSDPGSAASDWLGAVKVKSSGGQISHDAFHSLPVFVLGLPKSRHSPQLTKETASDRGSRVTLGCYELQLWYQVKSARMARRLNFIFRVCENKVGIGGRRNMKIVFSILKKRAAHIYSHIRDVDAKVNLSHSTITQKHIGIRISTPQNLKECLLSLLLLTAPPWYLEPLESPGGPYCAKLSNIPRPQHSIRSLVLQIGHWIDQSPFYLRIAALRLFMALISRRP